ncbi:MAG: OmpA family protein [Thermoleophilaceae bacterium]|nr:OmpA family protein [Thermoleophilaceae bacterium]
MSARGGNRRRRRGGAHGEHENEERWLLTYSDMITLLMALFIVMFSIANVNTSKFEQLRESLREAFSGKILPGGKSIRDTGASDTDTSTRQAPEPPIPAIQPTVGDTSLSRERPSRSEDEEFRRLKRQIDAYARRHGLSRDIQTVIARRGLVVRLLTDRVLFDPGEAVLKPRSGPILGRLAAVLKAERRHPIMVEGHTDNVPIESARFPTNWELSTARASTVVRYFIRAGVQPGRLGAAGYAYLHPVASNASAAGRSRNRRVEVVLLRLNQAYESSGAPATG